MGEGKGSNHCMGKRKGEDFNSNEGGRRKLREKLRNLYIIQKATSSSARDEIKVRSIPSSACRSGSSGRRKLLPIKRGVRICFRRN